MPSTQVVVEEVRKGGSFSRFSGDLGCYIGAVSAKVRGEIRVHSESDFLREDL